MNDLSLQIHTGRVYLCVPAVAFLFRHLGYRVCMDGAVLVQIRKTNSLCLVSQNLSLNQRNNDQSVFARRLVTPVTPAEQTSGRCPFSKIRFPSGCPISLRALCAFVSFCIMNETCTLLHLGRERKRESLFNAGQARVWA